MLVMKLAELAYLYTIGKIETVADYQGKLFHLFQVRVEIVNWSLLDAVAFDVWIQFKQVGKCFAGYVFSDRFWPEEKVSS